MSQNDQANLLETEEGANDQEHKDGVKMVPVTESIRYRKRAQSAEKQNRQLSEQLKELTGKKEDLRSEVQNLKSEKQLMKKLSEAGAVDMESALLVTKDRIGKTEDADIEGVIEDLKKSKSFLFANSDQKFSRAGKTAFARDKIDPDNSNILGKSAIRALKTGSRIDLHEYMKMKRNLI